MPTKLTKFGRLRPRNAPRPTPKPQPITVELAKKRCAATPAKDRLALALSFKPHLSKLELYELIGEAWGNPEALWPIREPLSAVLDDVDDEAAELLMTEDELALWRDLPLSFEVYRGCYWHNRFGLAWCLEEAEARKFPFMRRYRQEFSPLLIRAETGVANCLVKIQRGRIEIFSTFVMQDEPEQLEPSTF